MKFSLNKYNRDSSLSNHELVQLFVNGDKKSANILPKDDPNFMREKSRYESPIASREYIINLIDKNSGNLN